MAGDAIKARNIGQPAEAGARNDEREREREGERGDRARNQRFRSAVISVTHNALLVIGLAGGRFNSEGQAWTLTCKSAYVVLILRTACGRRCSRARDTMVQFNRDRNPAPGSFRPCSGSHGFRTCRTRSGACTSRAI